MFEFSIDALNQRRADFVQLIESDENFILRPGDKCYLFFRQGFRCCVIGIESLKRDYGQLRGPLSGPAIRFLPTMLGCMTNGESSSYLLSQGLLDKELSLRYEARDSKLITVFRVASFCRNSGVINLALAKGTKVIRPLKLGISLPGFMAKLFSKRQTCTHV
jgi:hypothetical protein